MLKGRRVGTLTLGILLIVFGLLFIARLTFPFHDYKLILSLWPIILILLGVEVLASYITNREEKMRYDSGAIILIIVLSFFSMIMASAEFIINHLPEFKGMF